MTYQRILGLVNSLLAVLDSRHPDGICLWIHSRLLIDLNPFHLALILDRRCGPQLPHH
jgi:hypothetical protein